MGTAPRFRFDPVPPLADSHDPATRLWARRDQLGEPGWTARAVGGPRATELLSGQRQDEEPSGDDQADRKIRHAIEELADSLDPGLWIEDSHLTADGKHVFHEEDEAVDSLGHIITPSAGVADVVDELLMADEAPARTAIDEATAAGGDPTLLAKAEKMMNEASAEIAGGHFGEAIEAYGAAWKTAKQSLL